MQGSRRRRTTSRVEFRLMVVSMAAHLSRGH